MDECFGQWYLPFIPYIITLSNFPFQSKEVQIFTLLKYAMKHSNRLWRIYLSKTNKKKYNQKIIKFESVLHHLDLFLSTYNISGTKAAFYYNASESDFYLAESLRFEHDESSVESVPHESYMDSSVARIWKVTLLYSSFSNPNSGRL